jgi:hypothetical protein
MEKSDEEAKENIWTVRVIDYREEPAISAAIASAKKFKVDLSLVKELSGYFPHLDDEERKLKSIRGPADLGRGLEVADEMLYIKDRASYIVLIYENYKGKLERLHSIVHSHLLSKPEVMSLKNDAQRKAIVSMTSPEIEEKLSRVGRVLSSASRVVHNINQTYSILRTQVEIVKEMMYEAGLSKTARRSKLADKV